MPDIILLVLGILGMLAALAGGVSTLMKRRLWWLALVGSIGAILCSPIAGIAATVITVSSRNDFKVKQ